MKLAYTYLIKKIGVSGFPKMYNIKPSAPILGGKIVQL